MQVLQIDCSIVKKLRHSFRNSNTNSTNKLISSKSTLHLPNPFQGQLHSQVTLKMSLLDGENKKFKYFLNVLSHEFFSSTVVIGWQEIGSLNLNDCTDTTDSDISQ